MSQLLTKSATKWKSLPELGCMVCRLEDEEGLVLTPFEKNLEVWRQLWRVLERSDIVVQASSLQNTGPHSAAFHTCPHRLYTKPYDVCKCHMMQGPGVWT